MEEYIKKDDAISIIKKEVEDIPIWMLMIKFIVCIYAQLMIDSIKKYGIGE